MAEEFSWEEKYHKCSDEYKKAIGFMKKNLMVQQKNFTGMVGLLSDIVTMVNKELGSHSKSVAEYSKSFSYVLHLEKDKRDLLFYSALLHDIGLITSPREVYSYNPLSQEKPPQEYLEHPAGGEALISQIPNLSRVAHIVRLHHEYWNGEGFPDSISGDSIPIEARVLAVTDAFDWLTRFGHQNPRDALSSIKTQSGRMFDPEITDVFYNFMDLRLKEKETGIEKVGINELHQGHILNDDLLLENGMLLYPSGTYLNDEAIRRIQKFGESLAVKSHIRVHL